MPLKTDIKDPAAYWRESIKQETGPHHIGEVATTTLELLQHEHQRFPINNLKPRTEIGSQKRAIIHQRDGGLCVYCYGGYSELTIDHVIPRSFFTTDQLHLADRSDNLVSACWPCNEAKSNYESHAQKKLGVVVTCWDCANPDLAHDENLNNHDVIPETPYKAFCGRCGMTGNVPDLGWIL